MDLKELVEFRSDRLKAWRPAIKKGELDKHIQKAESGCWFLEHGVPDMPKLTSCYKSYRILLYEYNHGSIGIYGTLKPGCGSEKCINPGHMIQCKYHDAKKRKASNKKAHLKRVATRKQFYIDSVLVDKIRAMHHSKKVSYYIEIAIEEYLEKRTKKEKTLWQRIRGK